MTINYGIIESSESPYEAKHIFIDGTHQDVLFFLEKYKLDKALYLNGLRELPDSFKGVFAFTDDDEAFEEFDSFLFFLPVDIYDLLKKDDEFTYSEDSTELFIDRIKIIPEFESNNFDFTYDEILELVNDLHHLNKDDFIKKYKDPDFMEEFIFRISFNNDIKDYQFDNIESLIPLSEYNQKMMENFSSPMELCLGMINMSLSWDMLHNSELRILNDFELEIFHP